MVFIRHIDAICGRVDVWSCKRVKVDLRPGLEHIACIGRIALSQEIRSGVNKEKRVNITISRPIFFVTEVIEWEWDDVGSGHLRIKTNFGGFRLPSLFKKCLETISVEPSHQWAIVFFTHSKLSSRLRGPKQEKRNSHFLFEITCCTFRGLAAARFSYWDSGDGQHWTAREWVKSERQKRLILRNWLGRNSCSIQAFARLITASLPVWCAMWIQTATYRCPRGCGAWIIMPDKRSSRRYRRSAARSVSWLMLMTLDNILLERTSFATLSSSYMLQNSLGAQPRMVQIGPRNNVWWFMVVKASSIWWLSRILIAGWSCLRTLFYVVRGSISMRGQKIVHARSECGHVQVPKFLTVRSKLRTVASDPDGQVAHSKPKTLLFLLNVTSVVDHPFNIVVRTTFRVVRMI